VLTYSAPRAVPPCLFRHPAELRAIRIVQLCVPHLGQDDINVAATGCHGRCSSLLNDRHPAGDDGSLKTRDPHPVPSRQMERLSGQPLKAAVEKLAEVQRLLGNLRGGAPGSSGWRADYVRWAAESEDALVHYFLRRDVEQLLYTPRYWEIWRTGDAPKDFPRLFFPEVEARYGELGDLLERLRALQSRFGGLTGRILVPDANVFLQFTFFRDAPWQELTDGEDARIVVPLLVVEQLDRNKYATNKRTGHRAHSVLRAFEELGMADGVPTSLPGRGTIEIIADEPRHLRAPVEDDQIVEVARRVSEAADVPTMLVTGDLAMLVRARALNTPSIRIPEAWSVTETTVIS